VVEGSLQRSGKKTRIKVRLLDIMTNTYIWSYESDENIRPDNLFHIQTKIVGEIAARLGQPYGVVQRMESRRLRGVKTKSLIPYKCVLAHYEYASNKVADKHAQMRDCLEKAVKEAPDYTEAWALLSWIYGDEIRYGHNLRSSVADALKRSEEAAIKALDINPESPRAHQHAASVALLKNDIAGVRRHLKIALALNPNDAEILAYAGWLYSQLGDWELSRSLVEKAIWLNPGHPPWCQGILFAYYYHHRNYERALTHALAFYQLNVLLSSIALAAVYGKLAKVSAAAKAVKHLETVFPNLWQAPRLGCRYGVYRSH
jgi:adenylate cyclase